MAITTLGNALLSMLAREACSGYDLGRQLRNPVGFFWHARYSQIYPELAKLEVQGLVVHKVVEQQDLPDKKVYEITSKGRDELVAWVVTPMEPPMARDELVLKAYSLWLADTRAALVLFRTHEQYHIEQLKMYEGFQQEAERYSGKNGLDITSPDFAKYATLQRGLGYEREYSTWCHWVADQLDQALQSSSKTPLEAGE